MRVGATIFVQNYTDWDRYEAEERGEKVPARPVISDRSIFLEEINIARIADDTGFDSVWTVEHHFTPYTMVTNPLQFLTYLAGITKRVDLGTMVVVLPWQVAANAQQFGRNLAQHHKKAVIFGTDGLFSPGTFTISGSYVSSFGPDITAIPADAALAQAAKTRYGSFGTFGPPIFAATHVIDEAISSVCKSGQTPSRSNVLAAIKKTNEPTSILGQPISFDSHGDNAHGKFFLFKIDSSGKYNLIPG